MCIFLTTVKLISLCFEHIIGQIYGDNEPPKLIATAPGANDDIADVQEDDPSMFRNYFILLYLQSESSLHKE